MALDLGRDIVVRWPEPEPRHAALLRQAGIQGVLLEASSPLFERACEAAGLRTATTGEFRWLPPAKVEAAGDGPPVVVEAGLWPGVSRGANVPGRGDETASASREPWVDANGYLVALLRTLAPQRAAVLGYQPNERAGIKPGRVVGWDTLELALIEARTAGGNFILSLPANYRAALLRGDRKALDAWIRLGSTARWLQEKEALFRQPVLPAVTALVEAGGFTTEIANLLLRRNASPALARADDPPPPSRERLALVAAGIRAPKPEIRARILAHAVAGASVVTDAPGETAWWRDSRMKLVKSQDDREFFALGAGQVAAYRKRIADPSEFALDVIDIVSHRLRAVRLWNAAAMIAVATRAPTDGPVSGRALLQVINYGSPAEEIQARVQGHYARANVLRPDAEPATLPTARRGQTTEVILPKVNRLAVVVFG